MLKNIIRSNFSRYSNSTFHQSRWKIQYRYFSLTFSNWFGDSRSYSSGRPKQLVSRRTRSLPPQAVTYEVAKGRLADFCRAVADTDIHAVLSLYPDLLERQELGRNNYVDVIRLLHHCIRVKPPLLPHEAVRSHVKTFVDAYQKGLIPSYSRITLQLLGYFQASNQVEEGLEFWDWVTRQDDSYVSLPCYGAAIELLVAGGERCLPACEKIYEDALQRFPRAFNEYHLQPGAITANPHMPTFIPGTSTHLLRGIILARLTHGNWLHAYLAMDRALWLHPSQLDERFFYIFLTHRPITEAFQVYCILCSSGTRLTSAMTTMLLGDLFALQSRNRGADADLDIALAILSAVHHGVAAGQDVDSIHLGVLMRSVLNLLPKQSSIENESQLLMAREMGDKLGDLVLSLFKTLRITPATGFFNNMISIAGKLGDKALLKKAADALTDSGHTLNGSLVRELRVAAYRAGDAEPIRKCWMSQPDLPDIQLKTHEIRNLEDQLIEATQDESSKSEAHTSNEVSFEHCLRNAEKLSKALEYFRFIVDVGSVRNMPEHPPNRSQIVEGHSIPDSWQWRLYGETTTDPALRKKSQIQQTNITESTESSSNSPPSRNKDMTKIPLGSLLPTNYSLEEIRYRNWCAINDLLLQASTYHRLWKKHEESRSRRPSRMDKGYETVEISRARDSAARKKQVELQMRHHLRGMEQRGPPVSERAWRTEMLGLRRMRL